MGKRFKDLTNQTFDRLKVLCRDGDKLSRGSAVWVCECKCGETVPVPARDLVSGNTRSCGCLLVDYTKSLKNYNDQHQTVDGAFVPLLRQKVQSNSTTGIKGVSVRNLKDGQKRYVATIRVKNEYHYLGIFTEERDAVRARKEGEQKYHQPYLNELGNVHKKQKQCTVCETTYYAERPSASKYCSDRCRYRANAALKRERHAAAGKCPQCGGEWIEPVAMQSAKPKHCLKCQEYYLRRYNDNGQREN